MVPRHVVEATVRTLLFLADVCGLKAAKPQTQEARKLVRIFQNLLGLGWPAGALFVDQVGVPKAPVRAWNPVKRLQEYDNACAKLKQVFQEHDQKHEGSVRFYLTLTKAAD